MQFNIRCCFNAAISLGELDLSVFCEDYDSLRMTEAEPPADYALRGHIA